MTHTEIQSSKPLLWYRLFYFFHSSCGFITVHCVRECMSARVMVFSLSAVLYWMNYIRYFRGRKSLYSVFIILALQCYFKWMNAVLSYSNTVCVCAYVSLALSYKYVSAQITISDYLIHTCYWRGSHLQIWRLSAFWC